MTVGIISGGPAGPTDRIEERTHLRRATDFSRSLAGMMPFQDSVWMVESLRATGACSSRACMSAGRRGSAREDGERTSRGLGHQHCKPPPAKKEIRSAVLAHACTTSCHDSDSRWGSDSVTTAPRAKPNSHGRRN
ncbi:hypothetical protein Bbelb_255400 [Branchiostoma belcheri]|nr:hypothetical protein Bbelb_255400 [Branchiostoma belcheri]